MQGSPLNRWHAQRAADVLDKYGRLYELEPGGEWVQCLMCGMVSHNRNDVERLYCGYCKMFFEDVAAQIAEVREAGLTR